MSDIFEQIYSRAKQYEAGNAPETFVDQKFGEIQQKAQQYTAERTEFQQQNPSMLPVSDLEYGIIRKHLQNAEDPEAESYRWATALQYSRHFQKPLDQVYTHLDTYNQYWLGSRPTTPKDNWAAINDSLKIGTLTVEMAKLATQWMDGGGVDTALEQQIDAMTKQVEQLQDRMPRPWYVEALKFGMQSLPFTADVAMAGAATGAVAAGTAIGAAALGGVTIGTGGTFGMVAAPLTVGMFAAAGTTAGSFVESMNMMRGLEYYQMRKQGVGNEVATPVAYLSGAAQAVVEVALGNVPGLVGKIGQGGVETITSNVVKRLAVQGKFGALGRAVAGYVGESVEEGAEEAIQELISTGAGALAQELEGKGVDAPTAEEVARQAWESAKGGFMASLVMGVPGNVIGFAGNAQEASAVSEMAGRLDREQFLEIARERDFEMFRGLDAEQKDEALARIWESRQKRQQKADERSAEPEAGEKFKATENIQRLDDGRLYTSEKVVTDEGRAVLKAGDPVSGKPYGYIDYTVTDEAVTINKIATRKGVPAEIRREMVEDLMDRHQGLELDWNPTSDEDVRLAREIREQGPRKGADSRTDGSPETIAVKADLDRKIRKWMPKLDGKQRAGAVALLEVRAEAMGMGLREYVRTFHSEGVFSTDSRVDVSQGKKGGVSFLEGDAKALIYVTENSDFSTWVHENAHIFRRQIEGDLRTRAEEAFGVAEGKWTREQEEAFAEGFEEYLREGTAPTEEMRSLFEQFAEWLGKIYRGLRGQVDIDPRIRAVYEELLAKPDSPLSRQPDLRADQMAEIDLYQPGMSRAKSDEFFERRNAYLRDKLVREMTDEEKTIALLSNELTWIPNRRAYADDNQARGNKKQPVQVSIDGDSLKWVNDVMGHHAGDALLKTIATRLAQVTSKYENVKGYHVSGDEFIMTGDDVETVRAAYKELEETLESDIIESEEGLIPDGTLVLRGVRITGGVDDQGDLGRADKRLASRKKQREAAAERSGRGEVPFQTVLVLNDGTELGYEQIKERFRAKDKEEVGLSDRPDLLFQSDIEPVDDKLVAVHNLDARKLKFSLQMGGLAMPSLAVIKQRIPFSNFGDITLVAPKAMVDPKAASTTKVFNADIYSPRYPSSSYKIDEKALGKMAEEMLPVLQKAFKGSSSEVIRSWAPDSKYGVISNLKEKLQDGYLLENGNRETVTYWKVAVLGDETFDPDDSYLREDADRKAYAEWASEFFAPVLLGREMFLGFTNSGNRRYKPYTIENVFAAMKQEDLQGGESFMYGLPNVRALVAKKYPTLAAMKKDASKIVSDEDFEKAKEETDALWEELMQEAVETVPEDKRGFGLGDAYATSIIEGLKRKNIRAEFEEYTQFDLSDEHYAKLKGLLDTLRDMPTEYFEAKLKRIVRMDEFAGAVVPEGTDEMLIERLSRIGVEVETYEGGNTEDRADAIRRLAARKGEQDILFQHSIEQIKWIAIGFDTWQEFAAYFEAMEADADEVTATMSEADKQEWYRRAWEQARAELAQDTVTPAEIAQDNDEAFLASIESDEGLRSLLRTLYDDAIAADRDTDYTPEDAEEAAQIEARRQNAARIFREAHPLIHANAIAVGKGRDVPKSVLKAIRTNIRKSPREYRRLYAVVTGDTEALAELEADLAARPEIKDPRYVAALETMSILEREKLARAIRNEEIARKLRSGEIMLDDETREYLESVEGEQTELRKKIADLEAEIRADRSMLDAAGRKIADQRSELADYRKELDLVNRRIQKMVERRQQIPAETEARRATLTRQVESLQRKIQTARRKAGGRDARAIALLNKIEAAEKVREQYRRREAERRAAREIRDRMLGLGKRITRKPAKSIAIDYADQIRTLQRAVDPKFRSAKTLARIERSRTFFADNPEAAEAVPARVMERIQSKPLNEWTLEELEELATRIDTLRNLGRLKRRMQTQQEKRIRDTERDAMIRDVLQGEAPRKSVGGVKPSKPITKVLLATLRPDRIADMLDGGKPGSWTRWLRDKVNEAWNLTQTSVDARVVRMKEAMDRLGFTLDPLDIRIKTKGFEWIGAELDLGGFVYDNGKKPTAQDAMYWYLGMENEKTRAALLQGNNIPQEVIERGIAALTDAQKELAAAIQADFNANFDRVREVARRLYNVNVEPEANYVPMRRRDINYDARSEEIAHDLAGRNGLTKQFVQKGFIKSRVDIGDENQTPVRTDLLSLWHESVQREEAFIHQDLLIKRLHDMTGNLQVRRAVQQRFGSDMNGWIKKYVNDIAQDGAYGAMTGAERLSRALRSNVAVSYLAFNVLSNAKQLVSVVPFLADAGPGRIAAAAGQYLAAKGRAMGKGALVGNEFLAFVDEKSPLVKHRSISREFEELKRLDGGLYTQIVKKVGSVGMKSLEVIDKVSVAIGWKAVYDNELAKGVSEEEAIRAADAAVVRTQPSGRVQDLAEIYRSGDAMKWFTMFTNALNAYWNMLAYDVPRAIRNGEILHATGDLAAITLSGVGIALAAGAMSGDDDEKKKREMMLGVFSQFTDSIPLVGSYVTRGMTAAAGGRVFMSSGTQMFPALDSATRAIQSAAAENYEKALSAAIEGIGFGMGLPVSGPRRIVKAFEAQYAGEVLGWEE